MDRTIITKLPTANGNMPLTEEEKLKVIEDAAAAYEKYLDALRIDWRNETCRSFGRAHFDVGRFAKHARLGEIKNW